MIVQLCQLSITSLQLTGYPLMFSLLLSESVTKLYNRFICHGWHVNDMFVNSNKNNYQSSTPVILNLLGDVFVDVFMCYVDVC